MGVKDVLKKLKPQEQSCCSVEIEEKKEKNEKEGKSYSGPLRHFSWVYIQNWAVRKDCLNLFLVLRIPRNFTFGQCKGIKPTFIPH